MLLSIWPSLFDYSFFALLLLRVVLGVILHLSGHGRIKASVGQPKWVAGVKLLGGLLLVIGLWTQPVALVLIIFTLGGIIMKARGGERGGHIRESYAYLALVLVILFSLMLTGPGAYALDLPL